MRLLSAILLLLCCQQVGAQTLLDSLERQYANVNDSSKIRSYLTMAAKIQNKDYKNCLTLCDKIISLSQQQSNKQTEAEAYLLKGLTNYFAGEYDQTLSYYLKAIQYFEAVHDLEGQAKVYNELGFFYRKQNDDSACIRSFEKAFELATKASKPAVLATALNNRGVYAQDHSQHEKAIELFLQAQRWYRQLGDSIGVSYTLDYTSVSFAQLQQFRKATELQQQAYQLRLVHADTNAAALSLVNLAEIEMAQHHSSQAIGYLKQCISISEKIAYKELTAHCYEQLANLYAQTGNYQQAYAYQTRFQDLNTGLFNENRSKQIANLQTRYETEKKLQQIKSLRQENELKDARHRTQQYIWWGILALLMSSGGAAYHFFKRKKQRELDETIIREKELRNKAIIDSEEKERLRIARDLHDGVAQTMTAAKMQLESFMSHVKETMDPSLEKAFELIKEAGVEVRAVSHSMVPNALLKSGLVAAVRDFVHRMGNDKVKINLLIHGLNDRLPENVETVVFRVLQELVNNIIKHANASEVTIQLTRDEKELNVMVEDNGNGFDTTIVKANAGIGLKNIQSRVSYLNGYVEFDSLPGKGTTVVIDIPLE